MSDDNESGSIIGTIISILVLAAIWPYLLAILGLYIAYIVALAALEWAAQNPLIIILALLGLTSLYALFHYRFIPKAWGWLIAQSKPKVVEVGLAKYAPNSAIPNVMQRKFIPSSNLYCYWCTKKLGIKAWEKNSKYCCDKCKDRSD